MGCPKRLYDTLSSFSNQDSGGVLLFGIDEKSGFVPVGVYDAQDLQKKVTEQCNQMEPPGAGRGYIGGIKRPFDLRGGDTGRGFRGAPLLLQRRRAV